VRREVNDHLHASPRDGLELCFGRLPRRQERGVGFADVEDVRNGVGGHGALSRAELLQQLGMLFQNGLFFPTMKGQGIKIHLPRFQSPRLYGGVSDQNKKRYYEEYFNFCILRVTGHNLFLQQDNDRGYA
jgi:hypothetical protein